MNDTTVLEDIFNIRVRKLTSQELEKLNTWLTNISREPTNKLATTSVCILEIVRRLYFVHKMRTKQIRYWINTLRRGLGVEILGFAAEQIYSIIDAGLDKTRIEHGVDVGELSLLSFMEKGYEVVIVSSDGPALKCFIHTKRCNPRMTDREYAIDEEPDTL
jgi:hypothetical protein